MLQPKEGILGVQSAWALDSFDWYSCRQGYWVSDLRTGQEGAIALKARADEG